MLSGVALALLAQAAFDGQASPPPPDYADPASWAAFDRGDAPRRVDVFYIQPTTYRSDRWNQDVADAATNRTMDTAVTERQLTAFAACCRMYQPRYRQASTRAFATMAGDGAKAYALAYGDVRRAFDAFLARTGDRPFIIAGHSQGALHGLRLIEDEIAGRALQRRLVAAYLLGIGIPVGVLGRIPPCAGRGQTRCVVSWNSFLPDADVASYVARSEERYTGADPRGRVLLCVNPLTFDAARAARSKVAAAACTGGVLRVTPAPGLPPLAPLPGGSMHMHDITLFRAELRDDAVRRSRAFLKDRR